MKLPKRPSKESTRERQTKAREDVLGSSSASSSSIITPAYANKVIAKDRCLTLDFLEREGFSFATQLRDLGLEAFCSLNLPIYPNLIKEYFSTAIDFKSGFKGNLRGTDVILTSTSVSDFLNIPRHGNPAYNADPREDALNAVLGTDDSDSDLIITANDLKAEPRLVLNVVHRILFPKSGAFEYISERDLAVMYHIIDGLPFDFPKMFMHYLKEASH